MRYVLFGEVLCLSQVGYLITSHYSFQDEAFQMMDKMAQAGGAPCVIGPKVNPSDNVISVIPPMVPSSQRSQKCCDASPKDATSSWQKY